MNEYFAAGYPAYGSVDDVAGVTELVRRLSVMKGETLELNMDHAMYAMSDRFMSLKNWLFRATSVCGVEVHRRDIRANLVALLETGRPLTQLDWVHA